MWLTIRNFYIWIKINRTDSCVLYLWLGNGLFDILMLWFLHLDYFDVTIVNNYGKKIIVVSTHPEFDVLTISVGGNFSIKTIFPERKSIYLLAFEKDSYRSLKINDKDHEFVTATPDALSHILYVESGRSFIFL